MILGNHYFNTDLVVAIRWVDGVALVDVNPFGAGTTPSSEVGTHRNRSISLMQYRVSISASDYKAFLGTLQADKESGFLVEGFQ